MLTQEIGFKLGWQGQKVLNLGFIFQIDPDNELLLRCHYGGNWTVPCHMEESPKVRKETW